MQIKERRSKEGLARGGGRGGRKKTQVDERRKKRKKEKKHPAGPSLATESLGEVTLCVFVPPACEQNTL